MKLSIITPCSRPMNLPTIYQSILNMNTDNVEWIIVYDGKIDNRILQYKDRVPIKLLELKRNPEDNYASMLRNKGIEKATGDYLYFLDDDNLVHHKLYEKLNLYGNGDNIIIFNIFTRNRERKIKNFDLNKIKPGGIDTGQILVPRKYKTRWRNNRQYIEEHDYIQDLRKEVGDDQFRFIDRMYAYYNYLRRNEI